ncbi:MAG: hypothetical protein HKN43_04075 [Rhodothermales bacterium]|nr:hypothetical protein [Rhodothermales bacterium]
MLKNVLADSDQVENVIEWNFGLIMFSWYGFQAMLMRETMKTGDFAR